jgi:putative oxidoreductase
VSARLDAALLLLRLSGLGLAWAHGIPKLLALAAGERRFIEGVANLGFPAPAAFAWAAALSETVGGILVALGLFTRVSAGFAAVTLFVAAFVRHHAHGHLLSNLRVRPASEDTLKAWGNPELALLYVAVMLALVLAGGGRFSLDRLLGKGGGRR